MKEKIIAKLYKRQAVHLATCDDDQPRVRPMTMIFKDNRFYFATGSFDAKSRQLKRNSKAEFCLLIPAEKSTGYLRGCGIMKRITDQQIRKEVADWSEYIYSYWSDSADSDYCLFEFEVQQLRYMEPGEMTETVVEW